MEKVDDEVIGVSIRNFVQLLIDGRAPSYMRQWVGGGTLVGIGKVDEFGEPLPLDEDARPICTGLFWRRLAFKCTFTMDRKNMQKKVGLN